MEIMGGLSGRDGSVCVGLVECRGNGRGGQDLGFEKG
jgi:hypothetical protein